jgi:hypothetical protein
MKGGWIILAVIILATSWFIGRAWVIDTHKYLSDRYSTALLKRDYYDIDLYTRRAMAFNKWRNTYSCIFGIDVSVIDDEDLRNRLY